MWKVQTLVTAFSKQEEAAVEPIHVVDRFNKTIK
jgi:hypothetical protein